MLQKLKQAAQIVGNVKELARRIKAPRTGMYAWKKVPPEYCLAIEEATNGRIRATELRPDVFVGHDAPWRIRKKPKVAKSSPSP